MRLFDSHFEVYIKLDRNHIAVVRDLKRERRRILHFSSLPFPSQDYRRHSFLNPGNTSNCGVCSLYKTRVMSFQECRARRVQISFMKLVGIMDHVWDFSP